LKEDLYSIPKAAKYCAISRVTLWKYVKSGQLKASQTPGGHFRILKKDLEVFMRKKGIYPFGSFQPLNNRILTVDDDPQIRDVLATILSKNGYQTEIAADGFDAGFKIREFKPGLVILDLFMPGMDGFEVCKHVKENPETSHIKILAITGFDSIENRERIMAAGADGYLTKPVEMDTLLQRVKQLFDVYF